MATKAQQSQAGLIAGAISRLLLRMNYLNKCQVEKGGDVYSHLTIDELYELETILSQAVRELL
jgi:hypothetical protein